MAHAPPTGYYDNARPEVAALVPPGARFVLDVGCGAGVLGRSLKAHRPGLEVRGVELMPGQAERARSVLDGVHLGGADDPLPAGWPHPDCVIFADILEHLVDPWSTLRRYRSILAPGGAVVASIPNVAHRSVLGGLLHHRWDYAEEGLLDRTHLRFFTRDTALEMFEAAGFEVKCVRRVVEGLGKKPVGRFINGLIDREDGRDRLYAGPLATIIDAITVQYLIVAS